ncbi:hypothetical protein ACFL0X_01000 [Nanoarchaeota archaeon]
MEYNVGTAKDLVERLKSNPEVVFVRAINNGELVQLLKGGPESFTFNKGTGYERFIGNMVSRYARRGNGTVILYFPSKEEASGEKRFKISEWPECEETFSGPVEVYHIEGFDWTRLQEYAKEIGLIR